MASMETVQSRFTDRAKKAIRIVTDRANSCQRESISPEDVLWALAVIEIGPGRAALHLLGLDIAKCVDELQALSSTLSPDTDKLIAEAHSHAKAMGHNYVGTEHLTLALLSCGECQAESFLRTRGITPETLRASVKSVLGH
jgi:ATP-dependent Clp protease ATP-binding subunit ClpC